MLLTFNLKGFLSLFIKKLVVLFLLVISQRSISQDRQIYGTSYLPQSLILNPGADVSFDFHIGIPFLSGIKLKVISSELTVYDILADDNPDDLNTRVNAAIDKMSFKDHFAINQHLDILSFGFRDKRDNYFSAGWYEEIDFISYFPKDILQLAYEGNEADRVYSTGGLSLRGDILSVLHIGASHKLNKRLRIGLRAKLYSSIFSFKSLNNAGTFNSTGISEDGTDVDQHLNNINLSILTSGIEDFEEVTKHDLIRNVFFSGNYGLGVDIGFTYKVGRQMRFTGSLIDFGAIAHRSNTKEYYVNGSFNYKGIEFIFNSDKDIPYIDNLENDLKDSFKYGDEITDTYYTWRPVKAFLGLDYSFGETKDCNCLWPEEYSYKNNISFMLKAIKRPLNVQFEATTSYDTLIASQLHAKFTYTIDSYSFYNLGILLSARYKNINIYGGFDNLIGYMNLAKTKTAGLQIGAQILIDKNKGN